MDSPQLHQYLMGPVVKGLVAGAFASFYIGPVGKVPLFGMGVSPSVLIGSSVAGASLVSALSHDFVLAKIKGNKYVDLEGRALSMVLTGGATVAVGGLYVGPYRLQSDGRAVCPWRSLGGGRRLRARAHYECDNARRPFCPR